MVEACFYGSLEVNFSVTNGWIFGAN